MKQFYFACFLIITTYQTTTAQLVEVIPSLGVASRGLLFDGDTLYVAKAGLISTLDVSDDSASLQIYTGTTSYNTSIVLEGNYIYFSISNPDFNIRKLNINNLNVTPNDVTENFTYPEVILYRDGYIFWSSQTSSTIFKININSSASEIETVYSGISNNRAIVFKDNYLYIAEYTNPGKLYKLDYTDSSAQPIELASGLGSPYDMEFKGDELYISLQSDNKIVKTDITQTPLVMEDVVDIVSPREMAFHGDDLYIIHNLNIHTLSKLDTTLNISENSFDNAINLFPNPAKDMVYINNINITSNYIIHDLMGRTLQQGVVEPDKGIDISRFSKGRYFLTIENGWILNFIKR